MAVSDSEVCKAASDSEVHKVDEVRLVGEIGDGVGEVDYDEVYEIGEADE